MTEIKQIIRIINADIPGGKQLSHALTSIYGVGFSFATAICNTLDLETHRKVGTLTNEEVKKIEDAIKNPLKYKIPTHFCNRRMDVETGEDRHIITSDLKLTKEFDVKRLKRIRSYRGIRHALGLPLRGQRTRSNFRKGKALGVSKKKAAKKGK
ncbi:MAG: 30S ribosomal protein S13 [Candidatus Woesearchaeota archaeon]